MRFYHVLFAAPFLALCSAHGATVLSAPIQDSFTSVVKSGSNYGGAGALEVSGSSRTKGEFDAYMKFDFAQVLADGNSAYGANAWTVSSVTLTLGFAAPNNSLFNGFGEGSGGSNINYPGSFVVGWLSNDSWVEGTGTPMAPGATGINYSNAPGVIETLGTFSYSGATSGTATWTLNVTSQFLADALTGGTVSLALLPGDPTVSMLVNSKSGGTVHPTLTITETAVPEPTTALLGGVLLAGAALTRRRARRA